MSDSALAIEHDLDSRVISLILRIFLLQTSTIMK